MDELTAELKVARNIASEFVQQGVDLNEVGRVTAYLRTTDKWSNALRLVQRLAQTGAVRSKQTRWYYQAIYDICRRQISKDVKPDQAGRILGWAVRLARLSRIEMDERSAQSMNKNRRIPRR